jgi:O-antigen/teichoic acid export membrane protein
MFNFKSKNFKNFLILLFGNSSGQILPVLMLPIIIRNSTTENFGLFSFFISVCAILSIFASGRLEFAIVQPKKENHALIVLYSCIIFSVLFSSIFLIIAAIYPKILIFISPNQISIPLIIEISIYMFLTSVNQSLCYYFIRKNNITLIANSRFILGLSTIITQILLLSLHFKNGLIIGALIGLFIGNLVFLANISRLEFEILKKISVNKILNVIIAYKNYPLLNTWGAVLDSLSLQIPILILNKYYSSEILGNFSLAYKFLNLPLSLITGSLSQLFFNYINNIKYPYEQRASINKLLIILIIIAIPFMMLSYFFCEELFILIFGPEWTTAGIFAKYLCFSIGVRIIVSPLSSFLLLERNLKYLTFWQIFHSISLVITLYLISTYDINKFIYIFNIHEIIFYAFYLYLIYKKTECNKVGLCAEY